MNRQRDILGIGALAVDDLIYVDSFPIRGQKMRVQARRRELGGLTANALVAASRMNAKTAWCGVLGSDESSRFAVSQLEANGVDCSLIVHQHQTQPRHSTIIVDNSNGERTILSSNDGAADFPVELVTEDLIRSCRVLFVDHASGAPGRKAAQIARGCGIAVVADIERTDDGTREMMLDVDHLIVGLKFARELTGKSAPHDVLEAMRPDMSTHAASVCVLTGGENGCWYQANGEVRHVPAWAVETIDTTGCGDIFHGVYAALLARGGDVEQRVLTASAAAAIKATRPGGGSGAPNRQEIERFLGEREV